jgi:UPF0755 protein
MTSVRIALLILVAGAITGTAAAGLLLNARLQPLAPHDQSPRVFEVERGMGLGKVARALERAELIRDARAFSLLARVQGSDRAIHAGEYELTPSLSPSEILAHLRSGQVRTYAVSLPEGIRATEIAERLARSGLTDAGAFLEATTSDPEFAHSLGIEAGSLEGYLYPETYRVPRDLPPKALAQVLVDQFDEVWKGIEPRAKDIGLSKHQIVTLASIVEKETAKPEERPLIAAVFLNRLERGMRLETDPTVIYGIQNFDGNLRRVHLNDSKNPYNTYRIAGLPPGPIASPGADALEAVVNPADSDYLFFVSRNDGSHHFSRTYREHVNAVNKYQRQRRKRSR